MSKIKKLVLGLGAILTIAVASVIGFACFTNKTSLTDITNKNNVIEVEENIDKTLIHKAGSVSFQSGSNTLNYSYTPNENAKSTSTTAYEYCFGSTMDTTMAVNLKSIDTTNVTVRYAYSPTKLTSSDTFTSDEEYTIQKLISRGSKVYIYLLVTPTDEKIPTSFKTSLSWYYGQLGTMTYTANGETKTKEIVKGQTSEIVEETLTAPEGYYFDAWFLDENYTKFATSIEVGQASKPLYARFANLPSDWLALNEDGVTYRVVTGTSALPAELVLPNIYNGCKVTTIGYMAFYQYRTNDFSITIPNTITIFDSSEIDDGYCLSNCNLVGVKVDKGNPVYDSRDNCNAVIETATNTMIYGSINTTIPNTVKALRANIFHGIYITSVYIPASVVSLKAFAYGVSINTIVVDSNNPVYDSRDNCNAVIETSSNTLIAGCKTTVIPETIETIGDSAFFSHYNRTVVIPNSVKKIGESAFAYCQLLDYITIGESVEEIGADAFIGTDVYTIYNLSSLPITAGSDEYGGIAKYATNVYTSLP